MQVDVNPHSGIFITMNPAGKGYGGRQKLPDNLKQLFRPVAMTTPDNELIAEVILFSEGFRDAKKLGRRLTSIFSIAKFVNLETLHYCSSHKCFNRELLSPQQHYDWGLRALKTVLKGAGALLLPLLANESSKQSGSVDAKAESCLIVQALRLNTLSKLTFPDARLFDTLVRDVFPGIPFRDVENEKLEASLKEACQEGNLAVIDAQVLLLD